MYAGIDASRLVTMQVKEPAIAVPIEHYYDTAVAQR